MNFEASRNAVLFYILVLGLAILVRFAVPVIGDKSAGDHGDSRLCCCTHADTCCARGGIREAAKVST